MLHHEKRLTDYAACAGCAAKMPQGKLAEVLSELAGGPPDLRLLIGPSTHDDAGVVLFDEGQIALVQTVDFFPPIVDDPYGYGSIAAANALSDVYAMGGRPLSALCVASFPAEFPPEWIALILRGGYAKVREAGAVVAGGHTVEGELLFGFAVTGLVDRARVAANSGAKAGDVAYLTKSLGMGALTTAAKKGAIDAQTLAPALAQMATLNKAAAEAMTAVDFHACTDVTGFGLVGHGRNVARASNLCFCIDVPRVPLFAGALELAERSLLSGAAKRGRAALAPEVAIDPALPAARVSLMFDAETSGGLLIAVPPSAAGALERELGARDLPAQRVGTFVEHRPGGPWVELAGSS